MIRSFPVRCGMAALSGLVYAMAYPSLGWRWLAMVGDSQSCGPVAGVARTKRDSGAHYRIYSRYDGLYTELIVVVSDFRRSGRSTVVRACRVHRAVCRNAKSCKPKWVGRLETRRFHSTKLVRLEVHSGGVVSSQISLDDGGTRAWPECAVTMDWRLRG